MFSGPLCHLHITQTLSCPNIPFSESIFSACLIYKDVIIEPLNIKIISLRSEQLINGHIPSNFLTVDTAQVLESRSSFAWILFYLPHEHYGHVVGRNLSMPETRRKS